MTKFQNFLISTRTMAVLFLAYAFAMAYATFLENDYGTPTAKALIYEAKWFELLMLWMIINFIGNIVRYRLWIKEKLPILIFHLAFLLIFIGGAITRYISFEGIMLIREGKTSNEIITDKNFFKIQVEEQGDKTNFKEVPFMMIPDAARDHSLIGKLTPHQFQATYVLRNGQKLKVKQLSYIQRKKDSLVADAHGMEYLHFVTTGEKGRENYYIKSGEAKNINGTLVTFNRPIEGAIEFQNNKGALFIKTPVESSYMVMATQQTNAVKANEYQPLALRSLYTVNNVRIVVPEGLKKGKLITFDGDKKKDETLPDQLTVQLEIDGNKQIVDLMVEKGNPNLFKQINFNGLNIMLGFGPKIYTTGNFSLKLDDFVMETYPGSSSPSAYESHVKIIDEGKETPYKIYMNHILDYKGYRFFQAGFDPDRQGTHLSVNHDFWGTLVTYVGYFFLFTAMFVIFFWKGTQFWKLNSMLKSLSKRKKLSVLALVSTLFLNAQTIETHSIDDGSGKNKPHVRLQEENPPKEEKTLGQIMPKMRQISIDEIVARTKIAKEHADKFGYLLVQNIEGRIVPVNTQALDILRRLYKQDKIKSSNGNTLSAEQFFLSANIDAVSWAMVPFIKINNGGDVLKKKAKTNADGYTSLINLFPVDNHGNMNYVLEEDYKIAFAKKPAEQSTYDQAVIELNDRVQAFNGLFSGQYLRIVPVKNDPNHTWNSWFDQNMQPDFQSQQVMGAYLSEVVFAQQSGNWTKADKQLKILSDYQKKWGKSIIPTDYQIQTEVLLNKLDINYILLIFYAIIGTFLVVLGFVDLFKPKKWIKVIIRFLIALGMIGWTVQFLGLIGRWYVSGHAPWSNGYEAIIFISWVGITAGMILYRNSNALIPAAGFLVAVCMMGFAHGGSALNPQITPLVPVLKSYWLVIHVAIITASYGFFGLSFIIAIICLLFYSISNKKQYQLHNEITIKELTIVSEMSLTIGLYAFTIGTFLGGIWANESWGRYWSWDPKETWALISVMVYAFVLHMRLVPGLRGRWAYHTATMFAISSVVMTYFGVNYYLSGLHSYAAGDPIPIPLWVYLGVAGMIVLSSVGYYKFNMFAKK